jgi:putative ABC transport system substrate-binding protein
LGRILPTVAAAYCKIFFGEPADVGSKIARIGFLNLAPASAWAAEVASFQTGLRELGYVEGKNIVIEFRWAETVRQLPQLANDLVSMNLDIIVAPASTEVDPVLHATKTIPIVFCQHADPVWAWGTSPVSRIQAETSLEYLWFLLKLPPKACKS